jgi:hypothetical protein
MSQKYKGIPILTQTNFPAWRWRMAGALQTKGIKKEILAETSKNLDAFTLSSILLTSNTPIPLTSSSSSSASSSSSSNGDGENKQDGNNSNSSATTNSTTTTTTTPSSTGAEKQFDLSAMTETEQKISLDAFQELVAHIDGTLSHLIEHLQWGDVKGAWQAILNHFKVNNEATRIALHGQLYQCVMAAEEDIATFAHRIRTLAKDINSISLQHHDKVSSASMYTFFMNGILPHHGKRYETILTIIKQTQSNATFEQTVSLLEQCEATSKPVASSSANVVFDPNDRKNWYSSAGGGKGSGGKNMDCRNWVNRGNCRYGDKCRFLHATSKKSSNNKNSNNNNSSESKSHNNSNSSNNNNSSNSSNNNNENKNNNNNNNNNNNSNNRTQASSSNRTCICYYCERPSHNYFECDKRKREDPDVPGDTEGNGAKYRKYRRRFQQKAWQKANSVLNDCPQYEVHHAPPPNNNWHQGQHHYNNGDPSQSFGMQADHLPTFDGSFDPHGYGDFSSSDWPHHATMAIVEPVAAVYTEEKSPYVQTANVQEDAIFRATNEGGNRFNFSDNGNPLDHATEAASDRKENESCSGFDQNFTLPFSESLYPSFTGSRHSDHPDHSGQFDIKTVINNIPSPEQSPNQKSDTISDPRSANQKSASSKESRKMAPPILLSFFLVCVVLLFYYTAGTFVFIRDVLNTLPSNSISTLFYFPTPLYFLITSDYFHPNGEAFTLFDFVVPRLLIFVFYVVCSYIFLCAFHKILVSLLMFVQPTLALLVPQKHKANTVFTHTPDGHSVWILDSGATGHMCNNIHLFHSPSLRPTAHTVRVANNKVVEINKTGNVKLETTDTHISLTLKNAFFTPSFSNNLLSVKQLTSEGYSVLFNENNCTIRCGTQIVASTQSVQGLYYFRF